MSKEKEIDIGFAQAFGEAFGLIFIGIKKEK
jgi:hypothetical protein